MCACEDIGESCEPPAKSTLVKKANQDLGETADVFEIRRAVNFRACVCARCPVSCSVKLRIVVRSKLQQRNAETGRETELLKEELLKHDFLLPFLTADAAARQASSRDATVLAGELR